MKNLNYDWLKRICDIHDKLDRGVPLDSPTNRCTKEILIDRYFKFLEGRAFKLRIPVNDPTYCLEEDIEYEIFYALFSKTKHTTLFPKEGKDPYHYSYGVEKYNGWNDHEFTISFRDEKLKHQSFKLHWNGIIRIRYEEIPVEKYGDIVKLFIDMKPKEELVHE